MRKIFGLGAALAIGVAGCQTAQQKQQQKDSMAKRSALDVSPIARTGPRYAAPTRGPAVIPPDEPTVPLIASAPAVALTHLPNPAHAATVAAAHLPGNAYKVKRGDTLFRIAKARYGDGKQWTRIASANPGLSARTLKAGQSITLP
ncbi:MAG TPA: LysM domain-containing protein [Tepidisphaeraceae bacterium]|nr:LysM domain-containing protein [Tepidisphaeraceae bacterium]